ncbi:hypothetical protein RvY_06105-2 [Ramazzottius varieornatus]|uniref:Uncharacterized protein n=1 Tax=Ramazzottius varieornatus TaxID=947166 RepID=A0A1D1V721_RAMVA|nr:hypothetical protein RvY_06105-2 [Ramazzottius varieornatus]
MKIVEVDDDVFCHRDVKRVCWSMYIVYLTSFLEGHDSLLCSFGLLGVSFHSALIADCISLFTVHVHCFYIYMARLFNIQLRGLVSLGRFFRGKKWNPLRERVDHVSSSVDQLFVGSLIMMVFVFLLPTIMTFYFVFASLHVVVRALQIPFKIASRWIEKLPVEDEKSAAPKSSSERSAVRSAEESKSSLFVNSCWKILSGEVM